MAFFELLLYPGTALVLIMDQFLLDITEISILSHLGPLGALVVANVELSYLMVKR